MKPQARVQAAIDLLDLIIAAARDNGPAADTLIARYFKERRYAGSKDRRAVRDWVYAAIRRVAERPESGRAAMVGLADEQVELAALFDGSVHGPAPVDPGEPRSPRGAVPEWIKPLLAPQIDATEQAAMLERAPLDLRVNRLKGVRDEALVLLRRQEPSSDVGPGLLPAQEHVTGLDNLIRLPEGFPVEQSEAWKSGLVEVQDAGSQAISAACLARPGETVLDLCAGAGGKTLALAADMAGPDMAGQGRLIAADVNRARLARLAPRAERAGATVETLLLDQGHEARGLEPLAGAVDCILIDAPCSGTGTWRRNPEARWRLTPDRLDRIRLEQARILDFAAPLAKTGGRLIYAVCSLVDGEGKAQVDAFLSRNPGWSVDEITGLPGRSHGSGRLLSTANDVCDGFFFARLVKA